MADAAVDDLAAWWSRVRARAPAAVVAGQAAVAVAVAVDALARPSPTLGLVARVLPVSLGVGALVGAAGGALAALLAGPFARGPRAAACWAGAAAAGLWLWLHQLLLAAVATAGFHQLGLAAILVLAGAAGAALPAWLAFALGRRLLGAGAGLLARRWPRLTAALAPLPIAALAVAAGLQLHRHPGARWRWLLLGSAGLLAAIAALRLRAAWRRRPGPILWCALSVVAAAVALGPIGNDPRLQRGAAIPAVTAALLPLVDVDRDGFASLLGGGDCAPLSAARSPDAVETPDDGRDQDCRYGDLHAPAPPPAAAPATAQADLVLLVTIAGLRVGRDGDPGDKLPKLRERLRGGLLFTNRYGLAGPLRRVMPVLLAGRLPGVAEPHDGGFPVGGPSLPGLAARAGWSVSAVTPPGAQLDKLTTALPPRAVKAAADPVRLATSASALVRSGQGFLWVHFDLSAKGGAAAADRAIDQLLGKVATRERWRVLVVALAGDRPAAPPRLDARTRAAGGPVALLGSGITAGTVDAPAGLFDVYPTLLALMGLAEPAELTTDLPPVAGRSLLDGAAGPTLTGWLGARALLVAAGQGLLLSPDADRRAFDLFSRGGRSSLPEAVAVAEAGPASAHVALLRDRLLAPRLRRRNLLLAAGRAATAPAPPADPPIVAGVLRALGCTHRDLPGDRIEVTLYLRGGELLAPGDLLQVTYKGEGGRALAILPPLDGARPFGSWAPGETIAQRLLFERRLVGNREAALWLAVQRDGKRVAGTVAEGASRNAAPVCVIE